MYRLINFKFDTTIMIGKDLSNLNYIHMLLNNSTNFSIASAVRILSSDGQVILLIYNSTHKMHLTES